MALYEGRFDEAEAILDVAVTEDQRTGNLSGMAAKYVALAEAYEGQGETARAVEAAERAMSLAGGGGVRALASAVLVRAGEDELPRAAADELSAQLQAQSRAYGRILEGQLALQEGQLVEAVAAFGDAQELADPWLARFGQGVAYVQAGYYAEALAELDLCLRRQGEVTAVLLDDVPSFRYLSPLWYWLGRAQEGVGLTADATDSYQEFLSLRPGDTPDALVDDARQRLARFAAGGARRLRARGTATCRCCFAIEPDRAKKSGGSLRADAQGDEFLRLAGGAGGGDLDQVFTRRDRTEAQVDLVRAADRSGSHRYIGQPVAATTQQHGGGGGVPVDIEPDQQPLFARELAGHSRRRIGIRSDRPEV